MVVGEEHLALVHVLGGEDTGDPAYRNGEALHLIVFFFRAWRNILNSLTEGNGIRIRSPSPRPRAGW